MKKTEIFLLAALLLTMCGCARQPEPAVPAAAATTAAPEATVQAAEDVPDPAVQPDMEAREAFRASLSDLLTGQVFPDGSRAPFEADYGPMEQNKFAIFDVDGDGREELLMAFTTTYMAAGQTHIYGFDSETGSLHQELLDVPFLTVYTDGLIQVDASHNHSYAGDTLWPHQMYRCNPETDTYEPLVYVDAWERSFGETLDGTPYPEELDPDNLGAVYLLYTPTWGENRETLSKADFEVWQAEFFAEAQPMVIPYQSLTEENIAAVTDD